MSAELQSDSDWAAGEIIALRAEVARLKERDIARRESELQCLAAQHREPPSGCCAECHALRSAVRAVIDATYAASDTRPFLRDDADGRRIADALDMLETAARHPCTHAAGSKAASGTQDALGQESSQGVNRGDPPTASLYPGSAAGPRVPPAVTNAEIEAAMDNFRLTSNVVKWQDLAARFAQERDEAQEARDALVAGLREMVETSIYPATAEDYQRTVDAFVVAVRLIEQHEKKEGT